MLETNDCPYCHGPHTALNDEQGFEQHITDDGYLVTDIRDWGYSCFKINYCPICGKK